MTGETILIVSAADGSQTPVKIWVTKLDHNVDKSLADFPVVRLVSAQDSEQEPDSQLLDIGRVKEVITVQGYLVDESSESAQTKKTNLLKIVYHERSITVAWGTPDTAVPDNPRGREQSYTGNISKIGFTETAGIIGIQQGPAGDTGYYSEKNFAVQFSLIVGTSIT